MLFAEAPTIPIVPEMDTALLKFSTAILMAAEMPLWIGPGLKHLQRVWATPATLRFALKLNGCLAELGWGGWKLVALPLLLKTTVSSSVLEQEPKKVLGFLASLKRAKKLSTGETDLVWRDKMEKWVMGRLKVWNKDSGDDAVGFPSSIIDAGFSNDLLQAVELNDILTLSSFFSSAVSPLLVDIANRMMTAAGKTKEEYRESVSNSAWVLGTCMQALAKRDASEWSELLDLTSWTRTCVEGWAWSADVLGGLCALSQARYVLSFCTCHNVNLFLSVPQKPRKYPLMKSIRLFKRLCFHTRVLSA
jgi:U3 small nucleolar RNA-associated protein 20